MADHRFLNILSSSCHPAGRELYPPLHLEWLQTLRELTSSYLDLTITSPCTTQSKLHCTHNRILICRSWGHLIWTSIAPGRVKEWCPFFWLRPSTPSPYSSTTRTVIVVHIGRTCHIRDDFVIEFWSWIQRRKCCLTRFPSSSPCCWSTIDQSSESCVSQLSRH